jgi:hypothetical protein
VLQAKETTSSDRSVSIYLSAIPSPSQATYIKSEVSVYRDTQVPQVFRNSTPFAGKMAPSDAVADKLGSEPKSDAAEARHLEWTREDAVIVVIGATGVGKSYFVQAATGDTPKVVHSPPSGRFSHLCLSVYATHELSVIKILEAYRTNIDGQSVILVDTIGLDDIGLGETRRSNAGILREIARCIEANFAGSVHLAGVLYMHDIRTPPLSSSAVTDLFFFERFVGEVALSNVVLVTNRCEMVASKRDEARLGQLKINRHIWGVIKGKSVDSFSGTAEDARRILRSVLKQSRRTVLDIRQELTDRHWEKMSLQGLSSLRSENSALVTTLTASQIQEGQVNETVSKDTSLATASPNANIIWGLLVRLWERGRRLLRPKRKSRR